MTRALFEKMCQLLITGATLQTDSDHPLYVVLVTANFVPGLNLSLGGLTLDATHFDPIKVGGNEDSRQYYDPETGDYVGAQYFNADSYQSDLVFVPKTTVSVPITVYGYALLDNAQAVLLSSAKFPTPIVVTKQGHGVRVPVPDLRFPESMVG